MNFVITGVFAAVIGLVIGYVGTALKMKASKEAAEQMCIRDSHKYFIDVIGQDFLFGCFLF